MFVTFGIVLLFVLHPTVREYVTKNVWIVIVGAVVGLVAVIAISCCESVRRTFPINLIFLGLLTIAESLIVGVLGALYGKETVRQYDFHCNFENSKKNIFFRF